MKIDFTHIPPDLSALKETRPLRGAIVYLRRYKDACVPGESLTHKIARTIGRLTRRLIDVEKFNYAVRTKWDMLHDGAWRIRVLQDLGGEPALARWEKAKAKADVTTFDPPMRDVRQAEQGLAARYVNASEPRPSTKRKSVKTDSEELFRLALINRRYRPLTIEEQWQRAELKTWRQAFKVKRPNSSVPNSFKTIPVTPHELRGEATKRRGGPSWEEIYEADARDAERENLWFETLINSADPALVIDGEQQAHLSPSPQKATLISSKPRASP